MNDIRYIVAAETGALMQSIASLEIDAADALHLSVELLNENGRELSKSYPTKLKDKLKALPKLATHLELSFSTPLELLQIEKTDSLRNLRDLLAHGKITEICGDNASYRLEFVKMSLPKRAVENRRQQQVERGELSISSESIRASCHLAEKMIREVEEIRHSVWQSFRGWPNYLHQTKKGALNSLEILEGTSG